VARESDAVAGESDAGLYGSGSGAGADTKRGAAVWRRKSGRNSSERAGGSSGNSEAGARENGRQVGSRRREGEGRRQRSEGKAADLEQRVTQRHRIVTQGKGQ